MCGMAYARGASINATNKNSPFHMKSILIIIDLKNNINDVISIK